MNWFLSLLLNDGIAHTIFIFAFVIALGMSLGKIKIFGVSLGIAFVLFVGLACGHFGLSVKNETLLNFIKDFGLVLFVFAVGLQVGPSFFSSFKKEGLQLNIVAVSLVCLDIIVAIILYYIFSSHVSIAMMVGILTGATLNVPSLGAAQEAMRQLSMTENIALGSAVAYPLGIVAAIPPLILLRILLRINTADEAKKAESVGSSSEQPIHYSVLLANNAIANRSLEDVKKLVGRDFIISRLKRDEEYFIPQAGEILRLNDSLKILSAPANKEAITVFIGKEIEVDWKPSEHKLVSRKIVITQDKINGKTLGSLSLTAFGLSVTRVNRSGIDLLASPNLTLQLGDNVSIVGEIQAIKKAEYLLGNTLKRLNEPSIVTIFVGILLGILLGSIPISFPNMPLPVKLGSAGGPLVVAILLGRFGYKLKLITYTTQSANLMIREMGICLFLASVGIGAGAQFVEAITSQNGLLWLFCGFLITVLPLIIVGFIAVKFAKFNFLTLMGVLSGSRTNPPLLSYSNSVATSDAPAVGYSTVYPLTMFLRILSGQVLILVFCG